MQFRSSQQTQSGGTLAVSLAERRKIDFMRRNDSNNGCTVISVVIGLIYLFFKLVGYLFTSKNKVVEGFTAMLCVIVVTSVIFYIIIKINEK